MLALATSACSLNPTSVQQRALLLADKGQVERAESVLREHLADHPDAVPERRLLVRVLALQGDLGEARRQAEHLADRLGDTSPVPWIEMGHAFELGHRYEEALAMYDQAAEVASSDPAGPREGGLRAARWGEAELAAPRLEEALRRNPRDARVWHALGLVRFHLGDAAGAERAYTSGLQADPRALENLVGLATLALEQQRPGAALQHYDAILRARPGLADAHLGRSWALILLGRLDEAERAIVRARELGADPRVVSRQRQLLRKLQRATEVNKNR